MTNEEAIYNLELLKAQIEWDFSLDYQIAIDKAIQVLKGGTE